MQRTSIEWVKNPDGSQGFSWNPIGWGCSERCSYCYVKSFAYRRGDFVCNQYPTSRQVAAYSIDPNHTMCWNRWPHLHGERLDEPLKRKKPATIFLASMSDLWDPNVPLAWRQQIWDVVEQTPQHTYLVLTKQPQNICQAEISLGNKYLRNIWIGITVTKRSDDWRFSKVSGYRTFVSFEPLLGPLDWLPWAELPDWAIIGAQTGVRPKQPEDEWVAKLYEDLNWAELPIFAKDNLDWPAELGPKPRKLPYLDDQTPQLL